MKKTVTKIICAALSSVVALGAAVAAGCSGYYGGNKLDGDYSTKEAAVSNGGFAVQKGNYVYFINGVSDNTLENTYGTPVRGSIMRISTDDLAAHNYASVDTVVPLIAYESTHDAGLFIYGDYIYYSTPSTARNADGEILNSYLDLKSSKLDGTETMRSAYVQFPSTSYDYRFVEEDGTVYILYVAEDETLYDESSGVDNLHSLNTATGDDTLLAYNIDSHIFDDSDKTNPRVYYTMSVKNYDTGSNYNYNQLYTVTASATEANEYDTDSIISWDDEEDRYINCGTLVFDGRSTLDEKTPFNVDEANMMGYTYTLKKYVEGTLFYTRHSTQNSSKYLYSHKDSAVGADWNAVNGNPNSDARLKNDGSTAGDYEYIFNEKGDLARVIAVENSSLTINTVDEKGKLAAEISHNNNSGYFEILFESATVLFIDGEYIYYSVSGGNGLTFNRINYTGVFSDYYALPVDGTVTDYTPVKILDLDSVSDWYYPEFLCGQLLFACDSDSMTAYNYIMACDLNGEDGIMTNAEISAMTEKYEGIIGDDSVASDYADTDEYPSDKYANLSSAVKYLFYTGDITYIGELAEACNAKLEEDEDLVYSDETLALLDEYLKPTADNDWSEYLKTRKVNGVDVNENTRDYYYSVLGKMTEEDKESLLEDYRAEYLVNWPQDEEVDWYAGLNTAAKVCFIIGMTLLGLLVLGGIAFGIVIIVRNQRRKKQEELPQYNRRKIRVDTTDDKNINVYEDEDAPSGGEQE